MPPPFGSAASLDFFDNLPPLEDGQNAPARASHQSLFEGLSELKQSSSSASVLYRLVLTDGEGRPMAYPSEQDLERLIDGKPLQPESTAAPKGVLEPQPAAKEPSFQELLAETHKQGGPVCTHCGATESPQWRRGPPLKAILCNACGTRYRRTNQLGPTIPSNQRKRAAAQQQPQLHCGGQAMKGQGHPVAKQPRVVA